MTDLAGSVESVESVESADGKWRALALMAVAELFVMALWFSASAVAPELADLWSLSPAETAWLTNAVQLGFVVGALLSAVLTLSDTVPTRYLVAASAFLGAVATATVAAAVDSAGPAIALRFLTGVALAGVYPPGMKIVAGWFRRGRGLAIGTLVGALTVGSALPHLLRVLGGVGQPRLVLFGAAGLAVLGGVLALFVEPGPYQSPTAPFDPTAVRRLAANRAAVLANLGYFGHMWELYAVWTWVSVYLAASFRAGDVAVGLGSATGVASAAELASLVTFGTIAIGGVGAVVAGLAADSLGRTTLTSASMAVSGASCVLAGVLFGAPLAVVVPFVFLWGFTIVADSAQFSAALSELVDGSYVGTALTLQTAVGFLLTIGSIQLVPVLAEAVGWRWAFAPLAVGPVVGTLAMLRLRTLPAAEQLAGGRR